MTGYIMKNAWCFIRKSIFKNYEYDIVWMTLKTTSALVLAFGQILYNHANRDSHLMA